MSLSRERFVHCASNILRAAEKGPPEPIKSILSAEKARGMHVGAITTITIMTALFADAHGIDRNELLQEVGLPAENGISNLMIDVMINDSRYVDDVKNALDDIGKRAH